MLSPSAAYPESPPTITTQARAADAAFLAYAPPPPSGAGAICLVDTGVSANAEASNVVYATSVLAGGGEDVAPNHHGTLMAMFASSPGPLGALGMVGFWPRLKVVSIRAAPKPPPGSEGDITVNDYVSGAERCMNYATSFDIKAINLSLGSNTGIASTEQASLENMVQEAHDFGLGVVAAAGNEGEGQINWPARAAGVFAVGAQNAATGAMCAFSNSGPQLAVLAPGCQLDFADPVTLAASCCDAGTSQAAVLASAAIVALRSYEPELSWEQAQNALRSTARNGNIDVAAAFDAVGLGAVVAAGEAAEPRPAAPPLIPASSSAAPNTPHLPARANRATRRQRPARPAPPHVRAARWRHGWLTLVLGRLPRGARARALITYGQFQTRSVTLRGRRLVLRIARPLRLTLTTVVHGVASRPRVVLHFS